MNTIAEAEVSTIVAVLERIEQALKTTAVPLDQALWSAEEVANYLKVAERTISESYALRRGFPAAIVLSQGKGRAHRRWKAKEIIAWAVRRARSPRRGQRGPASC